MIQKVTIMKAVLCMIAPHRNVSVVKLCWVVKASLYGFETTGNEFRIHLLRKLNKERAINKEPRINSELEKLAVYFFLQFKRNAVIFLEIFFVGEPVYEKNQRVEEWKQQRGGWLYRFVIYSDNLEAGKLR